MVFFCGFSYDIIRGIRTRKDSPTYERTNQEKAKETSKWFGGDSLAERYRGERQGDGAKTVSMLAERTHRLGVSEQMALKFRAGCSIGKCKCARMEDVWNILLHTPSAATSRGGLSLAY